MNTLSRPTVGLIITYLLTSSIIFFLMGPVVAVASCMLLLGVITYSHFFFENKLIKCFDMEVLPKQNPYNFTKSVYKFSQIANVKEPKIYISNKPLDQAFTFGSNKNKQAIVVFTKLLDRLSEKEINTLAALLVAQIKNKNSICYTISSLFINFAFIATQTLDELFRFLSGVKNTPLKKKANFFTYLISPLIYFYLCLFHPPSTLYKADKIASDWLENKQSVTRLLNKINNYNLNLKTPPPLKYSHLFLTSPLTPIKWATYLSWQPNVQKRTIKLTGHYPA